MTLTDIEKPLTAAGKRSKLLALTCFPLPASPDQLKGSDYLNFDFPKQILYHLSPIIAKIRTPIPTSSKVSIYFLVKYTAFSLIALYLSRSAKIN